MPNVHKNTTGLQCYNKHILLYKVLFYTVVAAEEKCTKQTLNILPIQTEKSPFSVGSKHPKLALPGIPTWSQSMLFPKHQSPNRYKEDVSSEKQRKTE